MNLLQNDDTIAAIATPSGTGAISVIRVSGKDAFEKVDLIFEGKVKIVDTKSHTLHYGKIVDANKEMVDDVLVSVFRSPNSYTGENSVEISTHGNPHITRKIISLLMNTGIRAAEPGEFTKRAFLNNRIDLSQAEAVVDVINAHTEASLRGARNQLDGLLSSKVSELKEGLINVASLLELELDFSEEDIEFVNQEELVKRINNIIEEIDKLLSTYNFGKVLKEGVNVAIIGHTNVGKSSLLNYFVKESRAIVSDIPGTTRDVIREDVVVNGIYYKLYDTAGIRESEDIIEREGINRSREILANSDLVILMMDSTNPESLNIINEVPDVVYGKKIIRVMNKVDILDSDFKTDVKLSAATGAGVSSLLSLMEDAVFHNSNYTEHSLVINNIRHYECLKHAKVNLEEALKSIAGGFTGEFVASDIRNSVLSLSEIIGEVTSEDVLNNIFSKFCIGK